MALCPTTLELLILGAGIELEIQDAKGRWLPSHHATDELGRYTFQNVDASLNGFKVSNVGFKLRSWTMTAKSDKNGCFSD